MKNEKQKDISLGTAGLGLVLGLFLGSGMVYWYFNRQNDSILSSPALIHNHSVAQKAPSGTSPSVSLSGQQLPEDTTHTAYQRAEPSAPQTAIEDIRVMQDSLLLVRSFSPGPIHQPEQYALLETLLGNTSEKTHPEINVEFWISPFQYSGYKKTKNRIIIFGLEYPHQARLHVAAGSLMMEYMNQTFLLLDHDTFQPLTPINNQELLENHLEP